jgi:hypothetical protein
MVVVLECDELLAEFAPSRALYADSVGGVQGAQIACIVRGIAQRASMAELIQTARAVAEQCREAAGDREFPPRDDFSFPLPPDLEPYRAETAARVAENRLFGYSRRGRGFGLEESIPEPPASETPEQAVSRQFCSTAINNLRQQSAEYDGQRRRVVETEELTQCDIARDVLGYPGAPVEFSPTWRTSTAIALVRAMYESRDFFAMPILADALQDAGCDNEDILSHCRSDAPHVRGCWVCDLVLGKE